MLTPTDKNWLRRTLRQLVRDELAKLAEDSLGQLGGYDGATKYQDDEEIEGRAPIGFVTPQQATGKVSN